MTYQVLVAGGGTAGMAASLELARMGYKVALIEQKDTLGGHALRLACMATDRCQKCGACLPFQLKSAVLKQPGLTVYTGCTLDAITRPGPGALKYAVQVRDAKPASSQEGPEGFSPRIYQVEAVVLATGFQVFPAALCGEYGYGRYPGVASSLDLEQAWGKHGGLTPIYGPLQRVAFIQCVGSREQRFGNPFCSKVCCSYALRMARRLQWEFSSIDVHLYYMNFQEQQHFLPPEASSKETTPGIRRIRSLPARLYQYPGQKVILERESMGDGMESKEAYDLVVLSVGITANDFNRQLSQSLGLELDAGGFIDVRSPKNQSEGQENGLFFAGTCRGPADLPTSLKQGKEAAAQVRRYLQMKR